MCSLLALGLLFGKESYCRSPWNIMDSSLVILSLVHIIVSLVNTDKDNMLGIVKVLRLLRVFHLLRVIKRAGCGGSDHLSETHHKHHSHLRHLLLFLWHPWGAGEA
ncbi:hypothetical protein PAMA_020915 [Pampus argenteus]